MVPLLPTPRSNAWPLSVLFPTLGRTELAQPFLWQPLNEGRKGRRYQMPKFLVLLNLTDQGARTVKEIPNKREQSRETAKKFGVERKQAWMTFGPYDFVHLYEAPNDEAMAKFVLKFGSFGSVRTTVMRAWDESEHLPLVQDLP